MVTSRLKHLTANVRLTNPLLPSGLEATNAEDGDYPSLHPSMTLINNRQNLLIATPFPTSPWGTGSMNEK